ncbi:glycosyltransferase, partial [Campylobacter jejuni]|nr:glycosyltransferase [Campylobacter jejuni]EGT7988352.1 glycosyltransferase [Campylobacter jejuni]
MKVAIIGRNSSNGYSGGRYHSWILAEQMSTFSEVLYYTNNKPVFMNDFEIYQYHSRIQIKILDEDFSQLCKEKYTPNIVILIPHLSYNMLFFNNIIRFALKHKSKLILLNFESPNWFNKYSPAQRDYRLWDGWLLASKFSDCVLSASKESCNYATQFYPQEKYRLFEYCYPPINSQVADIVFSDSFVKKDKRIGISVRFYNAEHKGVFSIPDLLSEDLSGFTLVLLVGTGDIPNDIKYEIFKKAKLYNINIEIKKSLSDYEKFIEIKKAKIWLFPSLFEGFGYPPIEAQYLNTHCVAFELPVLKEMSPNLFYAKIGDFEDFKIKLREAIHANDQNYRVNIMKIASFEISTQKLKDLIEKIILLPEQKNNLAKQLVRFNIKDFILNKLGNMRRRRLENYYNLYKNNKIGIIVFITVCFSDIFLRKVISKKMREKIRD